MKHFHDLKYNSLKLLLKSKLDLKTGLILYVTILTMKTVKYYLKNNWMKYQYQQPGDMSKWVQSLKDMIDILLNIVHFQRIGNWDCCLQAKRKFLPWSFASNRHNYAQNLSYHYVDMCNLIIEFPEAYEYLKGGGFTASLSGSVQSQIPMDQIIETTINHFSKETGLSRITENKGANERWVRINPFITALCEHVNAKLNKNKKTYDTEVGYSKKEKDLEVVKNVGLRISDWVPDILDPKQAIVKINDGSLAKQEMVKKALNAEEKGAELLQEFISRFTTGNAKLKYNDPIKRQKSIHI